MSTWYDSALCNVPFSHYLIESSKTLQGAIVTLSLMKLKLRSHQWEVELSQTQSFRPQSLLLPPYNVVWMVSKGRGEKGLIGGIESFAQREETPCAGSRGPHQSGLTWLYSWGTCCQRVFPVLLLPGTTAVLQGKALKCPQHHFFIFSNTIYLVWKTKWDIFDSAG